MNRPILVLGSLSLVATFVCFGWMLLAAGDPQRVGGLEPFAPEPESRSSLRRSIESLPSAAESSMEKHTAPRIEATDPAQRHPTKPKLPFEPGQPLPNPPLQFTGDSPRQLQVALQRHPLLRELSRELSTEDLKRVLELTQAEREACQAAQANFVLSIGPAVAGRTDWEDENGFPTQETADEHVKQLYKKSRICYVVPQSGANGQVFRTLSIDPDLHPEVYWMLFERQQCSELMSARIQSILVSGAFRK